MLYELASPNEKQPSEKEKAGLHLQAMDLEKDSDEANVEEQSVHVQNIKYLENDKELTPQNEKYFRKEFKLQQHSDFKEIVGSPQQLIESSKLNFPKFDDDYLDQGKDDDARIDKVSFEEIQLSMSQQTKVRQPQQKVSQISQIYLQTFKQKLYLYSLVAIISMSFYLSGSQQGTYNTMSKHLPYIFDWKKNEEDQEGKATAEFYFSLINSVVTLGAIFVQIIIFFFQNAVGRRTLLRIASFLTIIGCSLALIQKTPCLLVGRILNGCSIGLVTTIQAIYIVEYLPFEYRSYFYNFSQFNQGQMAIVGLIFYRVGLSVQFALGYGLPENFQDRTNSYWRLMVSFPIIIALAHQLILAFILKQDTPTYIFLNCKENTEEKTLEVLRKIYSEERVQREFQLLQYSLPHKEKKKKNENKITFMILLKNYKIRLLNGILIAASFQFGMSYPILMFSSKILEEHQTKSTATFITTMTPLMDFFSLFPAMWLVKRFGIKKLFCVSAACCFLNTYLFAVLGYCELYSIQKFTIWTIRLSYSLGIPTALYSYASEILPFIGNTISISCMYLCGFAIVQGYLPLSNMLGHEGAFICLGTGLCILLIILGPCGLMINTKGLTKEQINERFQNFRWFNRVKKNNSKDNDKMF